MSRALRTVALIAGSVALIATGVGAAVGASGIAGVASAGTISTIGTAASVTAGVASVGAQLTAPKPIARGSPTQVVIDIEPPRPYLIGRVMTGGVTRYDNAYGPTIARVPNPYRWQVRVLSGVGPIQGVVGEFFDFQPLGGFYTGFFATGQNLGARPQAAALVPTYGPAPGWTTSSRLSGCAHVGLNFLFDRDGERYASGLPVYTALCDGEKVYDPRQDSTYPGGSGPCRAGVESTYVYNANPACHAVTYALGRFQNGIRIMGLGQSVDAIDMPAIVDWANDCDANGWSVNMVLTEGGTGSNLREQRVRNLDDICAAGGARWFPAGGLLSFDWHRPRLSLATLTDEDILEAGGGTDAVQTVRNRMNGVRPQYISPAHNWQQITADEIVGTTYRTEDGSPLTQVYPLNGVTNAEQAGELASYAMADSREIGPMDMQVKALWRFYRPGDTITIDSSLVAYSGQAVINQRSLNPETLAVGLSLKSETPGKHDFALGKVAAPPPTPILAQTAEEKDLLASAALRPRDVDAAPGSTRNVARGTYGAGTEYVLGDEVLFSGSSYRLIVATSTGNAPPDALRWALLANAGSGPAGADGLEGLTIVVTNEAHTVATAADGSGGDYSSAGGQMILRRGATVLTPTFSIAAQSPATGWATIDSTTGVYTVTDPGVDLATATIRAVWAGVNYDRTYTLAKTKQGVAGPNLTLAPTAQAFTFTDGVADPGGQSITIDALLTNLAGAATFTASPAVTLTGTGNSRTLSAANFGANRQVTIEATLGGITDKITIVRLERNVVAPGNANRVPFSRMEGDRGWAALFNPDGLSGATGYGEFENRRFFFANPTATASGQVFTMGNLARLRVTPNERLSVQGKLDVFSTAAMGGNWVFRAIFRDAADAPILVNIASGIGEVSAASVSADFITVPAGQVSMTLELVASSGAAGAWTIAISEPMVTSAAAGQTVHPSFSPGPNASDGADPNGLITIDGAGRLQGIGTPGIDVDNGKVISRGLLLARPASGQFVNQAFYATDTREISTWDGTNWIVSSDLTATAQRSIEPQFPVIIINEGEAGHTGTRTVTHVAKRGTEALTGGTWSLPSTALFGGMGSINASTGTVSLSGITQSGSYTVRYTHTDGFATDLAVNVSYVMATAPASGEIASGIVREFGTSSFEAVTSDLRITLPSGVTSASLFASNVVLGANALPEGDSVVQAKWQRETSPGTWVDVGSVATSSPNPGVTDDGGFPLPSEGAITCNRSATGLTAGSTQFFRLVARVSSGIVRPIFPSGTATAGS